MEKIVKARKIHTCNICEGNIQKGEKHIFYKYKEGLYDDEDKQISIEYKTFRHHIRDCFHRSDFLGRKGMKIMWDNCGRGNHKWINEELPGPWYNECGEMEPTGKIKCDYCGVYKKVKSRTI